MTDPEKEKPHGASRRESNKNLSSSTSVPQTEAQSYPSGGDGCDRCRSRYRVTVTYYDRILRATNLGRFGILVEPLGLQINDLRHFAVPGAAIGWPTRHVLDQTNGALSKTTKRGLIGNRAIRCEDGGWLVEPIIDFIAARYREKWDAVVGQALRQYLQGGER